MPYEIIIIALPRAKIFFTEWVHMMTPFLSTTSERASVTSFLENLLEISKP